jgi:hypothetical protein
MNMTSDITGRHDQNLPAILTSDHWIGDPDLPIETRTYAGHIVAASLSDPRLHAHVYSPPIGQANRNCFDRSNVAGFPLHPICHRQLVDRLPQHRIHIRIYVIRKLRTGVLQQSLSHSSRYASLG